MGRDHHEFVGSRNDPERLVTVFGRICIRISVRISFRITSFGPIFKSRFWASIP